MATIAGVRRVRVIPADVAFRTLVFNRDMRSGYRPELVVVKIRWHPSRLRVAILASRGEVRRLVVGVGCAVVIRLVAAHAAIWRIVVIAVVASCAIVLHPNMCTLERPELVVDGESRRLPIRCSRVALVAGSR